LAASARFDAGHGALLLALRVVILRDAEHDAAIDRERLQDDVVAFPVLVGEGGADARNRLPSRV